jgi:lysophospholipid hydrolase
MRAPRANQVGSVPIDQAPVKHRFSTVAILAVSEDVPLTSFTFELYHSLLAIGPTVRLTSEQVRKTLGINIMVCIL